MKVILIACASMKRTVASPASELYISPLFTKSLAYARSQTSDDLIFVMSALHGLVALPRIVAPYDRTMQQLSKKDRMWWGIRLIDDLAERLVKRGEPLSLADTIVLLGGELYNGPARSALHRRGWSYEEPLKALGVGQRLAWLNANTPDAPPPPAPDPIDTMEIGKRISPPVFKPTTPYVRQTSSKLHGWILEVYDPTVSETNAVRSFTSVKKFTSQQKHQALQNYRYIKENANAETDH